MNLKLSKEEFRMARALAKERKMTVRQWVVASITSDYDEACRLRHARKEKPGDFIPRNDKVLYDY